MCTPRLLHFVSLASVCALGIGASSLGSDRAHPGRGNSALNIAQDPQSGLVTVSWTGRGVLRQGRDLSGPFKVVGRSREGRHAYVTDPTEDQALFALQEAAQPVISANIVGYVNVSLPPGLSLIANPLTYTNDALPYTFTNAPDGAQVYKYTPGGGYEVSTFDAAAGAWSNPDLLIPVGVGFYFNNPSDQDFHYLFIGSLYFGFLTNQLPAGISTKGAIIPRAGSINTIQNIPGEAGDELQLYTNDGQGNGAYTISVFDGATQQWVPDQSLGVAQGFWLQKQRAQDWVQLFLP